jgi:hypothetical protein
MQRQSRILSGVVGSVAILLAISAEVPQVQSQQSTATHPKALSAGAIPATSSHADSSAIQDQLLKLLRLSPTLTTVVARDPSLLSDQQYVTRSNPELAQFLVAHPEVARNPGFYLFSHLNQGRGRAAEELEQSVWPDLVPAPQQDSAINELVSGPLSAILGGIILLGSFLWMLRMFLENRRWSRIFRLQTEVHTKLIDRFGSNQELLTYMGTEAGRRFLEAAPIPVDFSHDQQRVPNAVARVLTPLQIGIVLTLLGIGLLMLRYSVSDLATPLLVFGIVVLMPGLGFIISAGITWFLAGRLGLMPQSVGSSRIEGSEASERQ